MSVIVCATPKEGESQRAWLKLEPEDTIIINSPSDIPNLKGRAHDIDTVYLALSASPDLLLHIELIIHYLGVPSRTIH